MIGRLPIFPLLAGCLLFLLLPQTRAQSTNKFRISYKDSLILEKGFRLLSNSILITNPNAEDVVLGISIRPPRQWKEVVRFKDDDFRSVVLKHNDTISIPVSLLESGKSVSRWDSVRIRIWEAGTADTFRFYPQIKTRENPRFSLESVNQQQSFIDGKPDSVYFKLKVSNQGNIPDTYYFNCNNEKLGLSFKSSFTLGPNKDTIVTVATKMATDVWDDLYTESVTVLGHSKELEGDNFSNFSISRPVSTLYETKDSRKIVPLVVGGGVMQNGAEVTYYGLLRSSFNLGNHYFNFDFRSRDFGPLVNTYQQNVFNASYNYKGFSALYGQVIAPKNFFSIGRGLSLRYDDYRRAWGVYVSGIRHNPNIISTSFMNDNVYGGVYYKAGRLIVRHYFESNFDRYWDVNGYLLGSEVQVIKVRNLSLRMYGGVGYEQSAAVPQVPELSEITRKVNGFSGGYNLNWNPDKWMASSTLQFANAYYPGITRGIFTGNVTLGRRFGRFNTAVTYFSNTSKQNLQRDTLFASDFLQVNATKIGLIGGYALREGTISLSGGKIEQNGGLNAAMNNGKYLDFYYTQKYSMMSNMTLTMRNAFLDQPHGPSYFTTSAAIRLNAGMFGLYGLYNRIPIRLENQRIDRFTETINGGPSVNFNFFKTTLTGTFRYNLSKTLTETEIRHGIGGQVFYNSLDGGSSIMLNGYVPLKDPGHLNIPLSETQYASLTLFKRINAPIYRYHLYDVNLRLYKDVDADGRYSATDSLLPNVIVAISGKNLISDENGEIHYKNRAPGNVKLSFLSSRLSDYIPAGGVVQNLLLDQDQNLDIGFKKGKKIYGSITIDRDTLSTLTLTPDNFKIQIADTSGLSFTSITDVNGEFVIYVPDGQYIVGLPAEYFNGTDFKPERMNFAVNLTSENEAKINFVIKQKRRQVRFLSDKN